MDRIYRIHLLAGAALVAFGSSQAMAQEDAAAAAPQKGREASIAEIVVTANRREERNQDVPIQITAFSPEALKQNNVSNAQGLSGIVPSLAVGSNGQGSRDTMSPTLRGQGATFQAAPAVVLYLNEVPLPAAISLSQQGGPGNFVDLENVQVLAGPQGTLFGRNTTGGAILLVPKKPTDKFEGYVEGSLGNYQQRGLEGALNIPIVEDKLMIRAVGAYQDRDGFTRDIVWNKDRDDVHWYSGRLGILFKPTERITNYTMAYWAKSSTNGPGLIHNAFNIEGLQGAGLCYDPGQTPSAFGVPCSIYRRQTELAEEIGPRKTRLGVDEFQRVKTWGVTNTTDLELSDELTVRNIFSYQRFKGAYAYDGDATPLQQYDVGGYKYPDFPVAGLSEYGLPAFGYLNANAEPDLRDDLKQYTEELQLQGKMLDDKLNFAVGGFYYNQKPASTWIGHTMAYCPAAYTGLCNQVTQFSRVANKSKALYAQATLDLGAVTPALDRVKLTAGYRYTWDTVSGFTTSYTPSADFTTATCGSTATIVPIANVDQCSFGATLKSKAPTWTFGLDYKPMDSLLLYAKVSRGYKAGGFNPFAVRESTRTFIPEQLTSYEVGFKLDGWLGSIPFRLNADYYYADYKNIQRSTGDYNAATGATGAGFLAASGTVQGFEAEATVRPASWLEIGGNVSHTDGDYKHYTYSPFVPTVACNGLVQPGGVADASCVRFAYLIPWIYSVHANITLPLPKDLGELNFFANYSHQASQSLETHQLPQFQPGAILQPYGVLNLSLDWRNVGGSNFDLGLFMNNATDNLYRVGNQPQNFQIGGLLTSASMYGEPRMYGLKLRYSFDN
ncbi:MAG: TonB-dependent receptor [Novosphingobium sp.]